MDDTETFLRMSREFPVRTAIFTFGLPVFAALQFVNGVVHGGALVYIALFGVLAVVWSIFLTRYHTAAYRRQQLARQLTQDG
jgi:predicted membrane chloride channel (bestrophin family)